VIVNPQQMETARIKVMNTDASRSHKVAIVHKCDRPRFGLKKGKNKKKNVLLVTKSGCSLVSLHLLLDVHASLAKARNRAERFVVRSHSFPTQPSPATPPSKRTSPLGHPNVPMLVGH
jgi:hypothetical protein